MRVFVSYCSDQVELASRIVHALRGEGYEVFFDRERLKSGSPGYHGRIQEGIRSSDELIYIISSGSIQEKSYARSELWIAERVWPEDYLHRITPVLAEKVPRDLIPGSLKAIIFLEAEGDIVAELIFRLGEKRSLREQIAQGQRVGDDLTVDSFVQSSTVNAPTDEKRIRATQEKDLENSEVEEVFDQHAGPLRFFLLDEWNELPASDRRKFQKYLLNRLDQDESLVDALWVAQNSSSVLSPAVQREVANRLVELTRHNDGKVRKLALRSLFFLHDVSCGRELALALLKSLDEEEKETAISTCAAVIESETLSEKDSLAIVQNVLGFSDSRFRKHPDPVMFFCWKVLTRECVSRARGTIFERLMAGVEHNSSDVYSTALYGLSYNVQDLEVSELQWLVQKTEIEARSGSLLKLQLVLDLYKSLFESRERFRLDVDQHRIEAALGPKEWRCIFGLTLISLNNTSKRIRDAGMSTLSRIASIIPESEYQKVVDAVVRRVE